MPSGLCEWLHPTDVVLASARFYSSLPVVGKHLEPFAGLTAMALWGGHYAPATIRNLVQRRIGAGTVTAPVDQALTADVAAEVVAGSDVSRVPPFVRARAQRRKGLYRSAVRYGDHPAQVLDVWRRRDLPPGPAPVLLFVPGGAWVQGTRVLQGHTEGSNVNPILELTKLINVSRTFQQASALLDKSEGTLEKAIRLLGETS